MSHKLYLDEEEIKKQKRFTLPNIEGKFGISFYIGKKEIFLGLQLSDVIIETITRRRMIKTPKAGVRVLRFD